MSVKFVTDFTAFLSSESPCDLRNRFLVALPFRCSQIIRFFFNTIYLKELLIWQML